MSNLAIVSIWNGPKVQWAIKAQGNHERYAMHHGYTYHLLSNFDAGLAEIDSPIAFKVGWSMPDAILNMFEHGFEFVFWMDQDSLFTNFEIDLEDLKKLNKSLVFTGDHNDICNGGHLFFRRNSWSIEFLQRWKSLSKIRDQDLATTHLTPNGQPGCQIALCALLGNWDVSGMDFAKSFNRVNLYKGNPNRKVKRYSFRYMPTTSRNIIRIKSELIAKENVNNIEIVKWRRLNSYKGSRAIPRGGRWKKQDPIVHLVAGDKEYYNLFL